MPCNNRKNFVRFILAVFCLFSVGLFLSSGCKKQTAPTASKKQPNEAEGVNRIIQQLRHMRQNIKSTPGADSSAVPRIDKILPLLQSQGASTVVQHPLLLSATVRDDTTITGADLVMIHALIPRKKVQYIEVIDEKGSIIATCPQFEQGWGARDDVTQIGMAIMNFYVSPSIFDDPQKPRSPGVAQGLIEDRFQIIKLPSNWGHELLYLRLVFENDQRSDRILLRKMGKAATQSVS